MQKCSKNVDQRSYKISWRLVPSKKWSIILIYLMIYEEGALKRQLHAENPTLNTSFLCVNTQVTNQTIVVIITLQETGDDYIWNTPESNDFRSRLLSV